MGLQMFALMAFQSEEGNDALRRLAEAWGWMIPNARMQEIAGIYRGIMEDTRLLRAADVSKFLPATVFEA